MNRLLLQTKSEKIVDKEGRHFGIDPYRVQKFNHAELVLMSEINPEMWVDENGLLYLYPKLTVTDTDEAAKERARQIATAYSVKRIDFFHRRMRPTKSLVEISTEHL
jgi:hypothetical protein